MSLLIEILNQLRKIQRPPKTVVNGVCGTGGNVSPIQLGIKCNNISSLARIGKTSYSGKISANAAKTLLSISGAGEINFFALTPITSIPMTNISIAVTVDDVKIINTTVQGENFYQYVLPVIGYITGETPLSVDRFVCAYDRILFSRSLKIEITADADSSNVFATFSAYKIS